MNWHNMRMISAVYCGHTTSFRSPVCPKLNKIITIVIILVSSCFQLMFKEFTETFKPLDV